MDDVGTRHLQTGPDYRAAGAVPQLPQGRQDFVHFLINLRRCGAGFPGVLSKVQLGHAHLLLHDRNEYRHGPALP